MFSSAAMMSSFMVKRRASAAGISFCRAMISSESGKKAVLMVGLHPDVVEFDRYRGLTAEKLLAGLKADENKLNDLGYDASMCFIDTGETAESTITDALKNKTYDCVMIGAGVRKDDGHFLLFEKAINVVHAHAPTAKICFNTGPTDSLAAVQRWV